MKKNIWIGLLSLLIVSGCSDKKTEISEPVLRPVRTLTVTAPDFSRAHEFTAVVDASKKADLSFKVSGELTKLHFNQGEFVQAGQVIAEINDSDIQIKLDEAQSYFDKAKSDYARAKNLIQTNAISQSDFDQLKSQFSSSKAKLDAAKNNLAYTKLRAPFSGVIARKYIDNFQEVRSGSPIVALHDLSNINLIIEIPESVMIRVKRKDQPPQLTAQFEAIKNIDFPLQFKEVATLADELTKTYQVVLIMPTPETYTILPGMTATVRAEELQATDGSEAQFYLPAHVVQQDSKGNFVYSISEVSTGVGEIQRQAVNAGEISELGIEIFSGIKQGDKVLTAGMSKVSAGMKVKL